MAGPLPASRSRHTSASATWCLQNPLSSALGQSQLPSTSLSRTHTPVLYRWVPMTRAWMVGVMPPSSLVTSTAPESA